MHCWYAWPTMERCSKPPDSWPRIMCGIGPSEPATTLVFFFFIEKELGGSYVDRADLLYCVSI